VADDAVCIDDHGGAIGDAGVLEKQAVGSCNSAPGVKVGEERERDPTEAHRPIHVAVDRINADTQNLGVGGEEAVLERFDAGYLGASRGCEIEGVEEQHHVPLPFELVEGDGSRELVGQAESGGVFSNCDHRILLHMVSASYTPESQR
jgi:hypothetical protein